jgi:hypothetical protein
MESLSMQSGALGPLNEACVYTLAILHGFLYFDSYR